jgi:hypothetical protein
LHQDFSGVGYQFEWPSQRVVFFKIMASYVILLFGMMLAVLTIVTIRIHENYLQAERSRLQSMALILVGSLPYPSS